MYFAADSCLTASISGAFSPVTDAAIEAVRKELFNLIIHSIKLNLRCFKTNPGLVFPRELDDYLLQHNLYENDYALLKRASSEIMNYMYAVQGETKDENDLRQLTISNHAIRNVSYATKYVKDIRNDLVEFRHSESDLIQSYQSELSDWFKLINQQLIKLIANRHPETRLEDMEKFKMELRKHYKKNQLDIYHATGQEKIYDEDTLTLVNVNRAIFRSTTNLIEALQVIATDTTSHTGSSKEITVS